MTRLDVVLGPRTRLGQALVGKISSDRAPILVARHERDEEALLKADPGARLLRADLGEGVDAAPGQPLRIYGCALGPIHPEDSPALAADAARTRTDLDPVRALVNRSPGGPSEVVFVSSVLAVAPREERRYYAGWKQLIEAELARIVAERPDATLSVVYPGRLVGDEAGRLLSSVHTTYDSLAVLLAKPGAGDRRRVVGADSRLFMLRHRVFALTGEPPAATGLPVEELEDALGKSA